MLLDEPSLGLAPVIVQKVAEFVVTLNREQGLTVLMAEQNVRLGLRIAEYAYLLENGKMVLEGPAPDMLKNEHLKEAYLGGN